MRPGSPAVLKNCSLANERLVLITPCYRHSLTLELTALAKLWLCDSVMLTKLITISRALSTPGPKAAPLIFNLANAITFCKRHLRNYSHVLHYPSESSQGWTPSPSPPSEGITNHKLRGNMRVPWTKQVLETHHPLEKNLPAWQVFKAGILKLLRWTITI